MGIFGSPENAGTNLTTLRVMSLTIMRSSRLFAAGVITKGIRIRGNVVGKTTIEWTGPGGQTWNPLAGCDEISPGCANCYAALMAHRLAAMGHRKYAGTTRKLGNGKVVWTGKINLDKAALSIPLKRRKPTTYFVNSMSDLFHEDVPDEFVDMVFAVMHLANWHTYQVLTKRPTRMLWYVTTHGRGTRVMKAARELANGRGATLMNKAGVMCWPVNCVWLGVSCEDQARADERIPLLLQTPAAVRFLSCEPLLGPVDDAFPDSERGTTLEGINWVICGGESGPHARPCNVAWIRSIVQQCKAAGVACFVKQLGSDPISILDLPVVRPDGDRLRDKKGGDMTEWPDDLRVREVPK